MRSGWMVVLLLSLAACGKPDDGPSTPSGRFAAFAVSRDGQKAAYTLDGHSQQAADESALKKCRRARDDQGGPCSVIGRIIQGCMAEAAGSNSRDRVNVGKGRSGAEACANAVVECAADRGIDCRASTFGCMDGRPVGICDYSDQRSTVPAQVEPAPQPRRPSKRPGPFGAIAVGHNGDRAGMSFAHATRAEAEAAAEATCRDDGKSTVNDCGSKVWFKDACGALAGATNGAYGTGWDHSPAGACRWAVATCRKAGGVQCEGRFYNCSPRDEWGFCDGKFKAIH